MENKTIAKFKKLELSDQARAVIELGRSDNDAAFHIAFELFNESMSSLSDAAQAKNLRLIEEAIFAQ